MRFIANWENKIKLRNLSMCDSSSTSTANGLSLGNKKQVILVYSIIREASKGLLPIGYF